MLRDILGSAGFLILLGLCLFGAAGRFDWPMAWVYLGVQLGFILGAFWLVDLETIRERESRERGAKRRDVIVASVAAVWLFPATLLLAGLDWGRYHWSPTASFTAQLAATVVYIAGFAFALWAMKANTFFAKFVRIQTERGHHVISDGPYAYVRHPGYTGTIVYAVTVPIALGSLWALIPGVIGAVLFVVRTALEDKTLHEELDGYADYAARVRWRLLPGVW